MNKIFISYSHEDETWKKRLVKHLGVSSELDIWDDQRINAGDDWFQKIKDALNAADIAILLISADFLTSKFILEEEVPRMLERREKQGLRIIPVIVSPCMRKKIKWLSKTATHPKDGRSLSAGNEHQINTDLAAIAEEVHNILQIKFEHIPTPSKRLGNRIRYFVEIKKIINKYTGSIHQGNSSLTHALSNMRFNKNADIHIKGKTRKLGTLIKTLAKNDNPYRFDESTQLDIGQFLYNQIFSNFPHSQLDTNEVDLNIITSDEYISSLPWQLLSDKRIFLSATNWSVSLSTQKKTTDCKLPPQPRILVIVPQPVGMKNTKAELHLEALEDNLSVKKHSLTFGQNMEVAYTWEDFTKLTREFEPHIIYFYGYCIGKTGDTRLCFAAGKKHEPREINADEFAKYLQNMETKPLLVYLNCLNPSTGLLKIGMHLSNYIPAVITSRHTCSTNTAHTQGSALLDSILIQGATPHKAVAALYRKYDENSGISTPEARWITPVIFSHYSNWHAEPAESLARRIHDPFWHLKIDRVSQFSTIATQTMQMLHERKPRSLAFVWYGTKGQGLEKFHHRLNVELKEYLLNFNTYVHEIRPDWPDELDDPDISFHNYLTEAFHVKNLEDIPAAVRHMSQGVSGKQTLIYVRHLPVTSSRIINPKSLKLYLKWWDSKLVPLLERNQFALLGISFDVSNPPKFRKLLLKTEKLEDMFLQKTVFRLLDEMERIARRDILDFFRTHSIRLPIKNRDMIIERILEKTGGHYEKTVQQLQILVEQSWELGEADEHEKEQTEDIYDY